MRAINEKRWRMAEIKSALFLPYLDVSESTPLFLSNSSSRVAYITSNPETQKSVKSERRRGGIIPLAEHLTPNHPPSGESESPSPTPKWQSEVNLFMYG